MSTSELDALILRNLLDLDATAQRIEAIDEKVWLAIDSVVERWADAAGWAGKFDITGKGLWVTPPKWRTASEDEDDPDATFWFEVAVREPEAYFDLSDLCGLGGSRYGFRFHQKISGAADWKRMVRQSAATFQGLGFALDNKSSPFMEVTIDLEQLTIGIEIGDLDEALAPIKQALDRLKNAEKTLGSLLLRAGGQIARPTNAPKAAKKGSKAARSARRRG